MKNAEYSAHMYAWLLTGWASNDPNNGWFCARAKQARIANIENDSEDGWLEKWFIGFIGGLGI